MRIGCLQYNPALGQVSDNIKKATDLLVASCQPQDLDLLVLPELAFTGYNFPSLEAIRPHLEPTTAGISTQWAIRTAKLYKCHVIVGYPEISSELNEQGVPLNYNATVTVSPDGSILATYRKSFLYYTDEIWAAEGSGFYCGEVGSLGRVSHGICMDINPKQFASDWEAYEFANHCIKGKAPLVVMSTAWLTHLSQQDLLDGPHEPDWSTMSYWISRLLPLDDLSEGEEYTVVFVNRIGTEANDNRQIVTKRGQIIDLGENVSYAGTSCVLRYTSDGRFVHGMLGRAEEDVLVVNTAETPKWKLARKIESDDD